MARPAFEGSKGTTARHTDECSGPGVEVDGKVSIAAAYQVLYSQSGD